jgi:DNA invertase Pin-like site-specific DNA recombinase
MKAVESGEIETVFVCGILSAIAQLERDLIAERVRNGLANAKAKGKRIGRQRKHNSVLIESLLDAGLSYREIGRIAKCSHGSAHAQKKEWLEKKAALKEAIAPIFNVEPSPQTPTSLEESATVPSTT